MNKFDWITEDVRTVVAVYPFAYCCCDRNGFYITSEGEVVGQGKKPAKAWKHAADKLRKSCGKVARKTKKGSKATKP